tara:strand:- start:381 stop:617 length:237 start_codon:yes stop_codon:yes gene_type:complete
MKLIDLAIKKYHDLKREKPNLTKSQLVYNAGWDGAGEWTCCCCGRMIGKNLKGESPFLMARQHSENCGKLSDFDIEGK